MLTWFYSLRLVRICLLFVFVNIGDGCSCARTRLMWFGTLWRHTTNIVQSQRLQVERKQLTWLKAFAWNWTAPMWICRERCWGYRAFAWIRYIDAKAFKVMQWRSDDMWKWRERSNPRRTIETLTSLQVQFAAVAHFWVSVREGENTQWACHPLTFCWRGVKRLTSAPPRTLVHRPSSQSCPHEITCHK